MKKLFLAASLATLAACSSSSNDSTNGGDPKTPTSSSDKFFLTAQQPVIVDVVNGTTEQQDHLFVSDGTESGTVKIMNVDDFQISKPLKIGNRWIFMLLRNGQDAELWLSDGTVAGTVRQADDAQTPLLVRNLRVTHGYAYFSASTAAHGRELWRYDDATGNVARLSDINPGAASSDPSDMQFVSFDNRIYFSAYAGSGVGRELYAIPEGNNPALNPAVLIKDINTGEGSANPFHMTEFNNKIYFQAWDGGNGTGGGNEVWMSDGTVNGTTMLKDLSPTGHSYPNSFTVVGNDLYFVTGNGATKGYLWKTRGTSESTVAVARAYHQQASHLTAFGDKLVYRAEVSNKRDVLLMVEADPNNNTVNLTSADSAQEPSDLLVFNNALYFNAKFNDSTEAELYRLTSAEFADHSNPTLILNINNSGSSNPVDLIELNNRIYFSADDGVNGRELWQSDGSTASLLDDINNGSDSSYPVLKISEYLRINL